jgi:hypothetical protein
MVSGVHVELMRNESSEGEAMVDNDFTAEFPRVMHDAREHFHDLPLLCFYKECKGST